MNIVREILDDGDKGAARLFELYGDRLTAAAVALCENETDAKDLVAETIDIAVRTIDRCRDEAAFYRWLCGILQNRYRNSVRRKSRTNEIPVPDLPDETDDGGAERIVQTLDAGILRDSVDALPPDMREAILLRYFMDMPLGRIAKFLSVPVGTVKSRLHYARIALARRLGAHLKKPAVALFAAALFLLTATAAVFWGGSRFVAADGEPRIMGGPRFVAAASMESRRPGGSRADGGRGATALPGGPRFVAAASVEDTAPSPTTNTLSTTEEPTMKLSQISSSKRARGAYVLAALSALTGVSLGADVDWNVASGRATVAANWKTKTVPGAADTARVDNNGECLVMDGDSLSPALLYVGNWDTSSSRSNRVVQTGGTVAVSGDIHMANNQAKGYWFLSGGTASVGADKAFYVTHHSGYGYVEISQSGVLDVSAGTATLTFGLWNADNVESKGRGEVRVKEGGVARIRYFRFTSPNGRFVFDGGTLQNTVDTASFATRGNKNGAGSCQPFYVADGGAIIDTQGYAVTISLNLQAEEGATGGGLVKRGTGTLTLAGANTFKGDIVVAEGTLAVAAVSAIPVPGVTKITVKSGATLAVTATLTDAEKAAILSSLVNEGGTVTGLDGVEPATLATFATPNADITISADITASGATKTGDYALTLTGRNDFNGQITVNGGTLSADFGQGLAATDNVLLNGGYASFASPSGLVTAGLGTGAGELQFLSNGIEGFANPYADTTLTVRLFNDATHVLTMGTAAFNPQRLVLNHGKAKGPIVFENPIDTAGKAFNIFNGGNGSTPATLTGALTGGGAFTMSGGSILNMASMNTIGSFTMTQGRTVFTEGSVNNIAGAVAVSGGTLVFSNATTTVTSGDVYTEGTGTLLVKGGTFDDKSSGWSYQKGTSSMVFDGADVSFANQLHCGRENQKNDSVSLVITNGATVNAKSAVYVRSGKLVVSGTGSLLKPATSEIQLGYETGDTHKTIMTSEMVVSDGARVELPHNIRMAIHTNITATLRVTGGTVKFPGDGKSLSVGHSGDATLEVSGTGRVELTGTDGLVMTPTWGLNGYLAGRTRGAVRILTGGTIHTPQLYAGYNNRDNSVAFDGGTLELDNGSFATLFDKVVTRYVGVNGGVIDTDWSHTASGPFVALTNQTAATVATADFATTPAFTKKGTGTLTLKGANTYTCATAVDEGTLALASGASLPASAVVRLGGGTLDLGGNSVAVRALTGAGAVKNGTLTVTEGVYPGHPGGVGVITLDATASLVGTVYVDAAANGVCDRIDAAGAVDLTALTFAVADGAAFSKDAGRYVLLTAASTAGLPSATGVPAGFGVRASNGRVTLARKGFMLTLR